MERQIKLGTLYDFNKQLMLEAPILTTKKIKKVQAELEEWFNWQLDCYAMLLCRERYDFTIFHLYETQNINPPKVAAKELIKLLNSRGKIKSIEKDTITNNAWEIWLEIDNEAFCYYLFNCDDFVIEC